MHAEDLQELDLTVDAAWERAISNLRKLTFDGETIRQVMIKAKDGRNWGYWIGNEFTSSSVLLPQFHRWTCNELQGDSFLVCVASANLVMILQASHAEELAEFDRYIAKVLEGSHMRLSDRWFVMDETGLRAYQRAEADQREEANDENVK